MVKPKPAETRAESTPRSQLFMEHSHRLFKTHMYPANRCLSMKFQERIFLDLGRPSEEQTRTVVCFRLSETNYAKHNASVSHGRYYLPLSWAHRSLAIRGHSLHARS